jgi:hypothetical protein
MFQAVAASSAEAMLFAIEGSTELKIQDRTRLLQRS